MSGATTPGPWRWEIDRKSKRISLCGGKPQFDLTVVAFERWGMNRAQPMFREIVAGMDLLHKVSEKPSWVKPIPGREHHESWCATISHPDAELIASAPLLLSQRDELLAALKGLHSYLSGTSLRDLAIMDAARAAIAKCEPAASGEVGK